MEIINAVEVAERICVDEPKNQGFAKKCHKWSQMPIQIPLGIFVDRVESSCRSFNLQAHLSRFLASDQRCISVDPRRLIDTFGLALELLNSTLGCSSFFTRAFAAIAQLYEAARLHKVSCTTPPQNVAQFSPDICIPKFNDTVPYTLVN